MRFIFSLDYQSRIWATQAELPQENGPSRPLGELDPGGGNNTRINTGR